MDNEEKRLYNNILKHILVEAISKKKKKKKNIPSSTKNYRRKKMKFVNIKKIKNLLDL